jgi:hypothetical protein
MYNQVAAKYDDTIWSWLNLINKFEGEESALFSFDIAVNELKAVLKDRKFD